MEYFRILFNSKRSQHFVSPGIISMQVKGNLWRDQEGAVGCNVHSGLLDSFLGGWWFPSGWVLSKYMLRICLPKLFNVSSSEPSYFFSVVKGKSLISRKKNLCKFIFLSFCFKSWKVPKSTVITVSWRQISLTQVYLYSCQPRKEGPGWWKCVHLRH